MGDPDKLHDRQLDARRPGRLVGRQLSEQRDLAEPWSPFLSRAVGSGVERAAAGSARLPGPRRLFVHIPSGHRRPCGCDRQCIARAGASRRTAWAPNTSTRRARQQLLRAHAPRRGPLGGAFDARPLPRRTAMATDSASDGCRTPRPDEPASPVRDAAGIAGLAERSADAEQQPPRSCDGGATLERTESPRASSTAAGTAGPVLEFTDGVRDEPLTTHIKRLREEKNRLRDERKKLQRALKNAERKKARLRHKARQLSESDLLAVIQLRNLDKEVQSARKAARRTAEPSAASAGGETSPSQPAKERGHLANAVVEDAAGVEG